MEHHAAELARTAGLRDFHTPRLEDVDRRRSQLWLLSLLVGLTVPSVIVFVGLDLIDDALGGVLDVRTVRLILFALLVAVFGYIAEREVTLRRLTSLLVDERVLTASLVARVEELDALLEASRAMNSNLELESVLDVILHSACDLLEADAGSIQLVAEDDRSVLEVAAVQGASTAVCGQRQDVGEGLAGSAAATREPLLVTGHHADSRTDYGVGSALVVPLVHRDDLVGVLNLSGGVGGEGFNEFQFRSVAVFAETAAAAIANAHVHARSEQRIRALTEIDQLKTEFLALVTHELRTPLSSLIGVAATLSKNANRLSSDQVRQLAEMGRVQGWRLERLVGDLLQSAEAQNGTLRLRGEMQDLVALLASIVDELGPAATSHALRVVTPPRPVLRRVDADAVRRIVSNLLTNAVKYTPPGTAITITLSADSGGVVLTVADKGPGIPPEERAEMFAKFRRGAMVAHTAGLGLGLYIVRSLAEAHGGEASLREGDRGGCEFVVRLAELAGQPAARVAEAVPAR